MNMGTLATPAVSATAPRTIVADPNETPETFGVEPGGILVFSNRSHKFPTFEIQFIGPSPASPGDILTGTASVVIHVPTTTTGIFEYQIQHFPATGTISKTTGTFAVHSCIGC
jgi:hypothetical protein